MHAEREVRRPSGWGMLLVNLLLYALAIYFLVRGGQSHSLLMLLLGGVGGLLLALLASAGFFVVNPNEAMVLLLFGDYIGSVRNNGFWWTNPFNQKVRLSLRARTLNGPILKVNDRAGNPIEIAAVVVWQVKDTAMSVFEVDNYTDFVKTQSETAVRHLASAYPYDGGEEELSLRGATDEVSARLCTELQERLARAGVHVIEARLSHLAYSPEIAGAMLQRQQAGAVIAARKKIVEGAVGIVQDALRELNEGDFGELDEERKAAMMSNLLVVLCSQHSAQPIVNAGTIYH
ncbi:MAG: SPFH domain-containing protein [Candidatus Eisenbacteria bacterium]|nr:SPFH domain-containing protein [Candidatus Eisenbacteria bacterium]